MYKNNSRPLLRILLTAAVLLGALLAGPFAQARTIVFPPDRALIDESSIEVLGYLPPGGGKGKLGVASSEAPQQLDVPVGAFAVSVKLSPGVNTISLGDEIVRVFFAPESAPPEAKAYRRPDLHAVDNSCDDCHLLEGESPGLVEEGGELCAACHDDVTADDGGEKFGTTHPPADEGECLECHAFHGAALGSFSSEDLAALCNACHDDFREGEGLTVHPPVDEGDCLACHGPHGSNHEALLVAEPAEVCFECHDNPALDDDGGEWSTPHPALDDGCTACHSPHSSTHGSLLLNEVAGLCSECHDDKTVDGEGNAWSTPHPPVDEGDCAACHLPHGSAQSALLSHVVPDICSECHDDKTVDGEGNAWSTPHPPVDEGDCLACHGPHGSAQSALLTQAVPQICNECHDDMQVDEFGDRWEFPHDPVASGECTACHSPHGSALTSLLPSQVNGLCLQCHDSAHEHPTAPSESEEVKAPPDFPVVEGGRYACSGCHLPHGSSVEFLKRGSMIELCTICHPV